MLITSNEHLCLNIWPKTSNQDIGTENMILIIWYKKAIKQTKINFQQYHQMGPSSKKTCYISYISFYLKNSYIHQITNTWFYYRLLGSDNTKILEPNWHSLPITKQRYRDVMSFISWACIFEPGLWQSIEFYQFTIFILLNKLIYYIVLV